jgi:hypothetical protein
MSGALDLLFLKVVHDGGQGLPRATLRRRVRLTTSPAAYAFQELLIRVDTFLYLLRIVIMIEQVPPGCSTTSFSKLHVFQGFLPSEVSVKGAGPR